MQITQHQLDTHLKNNLSRIYLISTDTVFLAIETREKIICAAKQNFFLEHIIFHIEMGAQYEVLLNATQNQNLFSEKKIIDIRNPNAKFDEILMSELEKNDAFNLLIITTDQLTSAQQKTKWFSFIQKTGVYLPIFSMEKPALMQWIIDRGKKLTLQIDQESAELLMHYTEGNVTATHQAIEKLSLLYQNEKITAEKMSLALIENTSFNAFDLSKHFLLGNTKQIIKIIANLKNTDNELPMLLWILTKDIRELIMLHNNPLYMQKIWGFKKPFFQVALKNTSVNTLKKALIQASKIDQMFKGFAIGNPWENLLSLCFMLCKRPG